VTADASAALACGYAGYSTAATPAVSRSAGQGRKLLRGHREAPEGVIYRLTGLFREVAEQAEPVGNRGRRRKVLPTDNGATDELGLESASSIAIIKRLRFTEDQPLPWPPPRLPPDTGALILQDHPANGVSMRDSPVIGCAAVCGVHLADVTSARTMCRDRCWTSDAGQSLLVL
jgi:hypothetical protein